MSLWKIIMCVTGLCLLLLISVPQLEATIPITIGAGAGALALTAPQVIDEIMIFNN